MITLLHVSLFLLRDDRVLLVQEGDPEDDARWNLPGGHVEPGEAISSGAIREALEETGLAVTLNGLVGIYAGPGTPEKRAIRFVFRAEAAPGEPRPGESELDVRWYSRAELAAFPEDRLLGAPTLRQILSDGFDSSCYPLSVLRD